MLQIVRLGEVEHYPILALVKRQLTFLRKAGQRPDGGKTLGFWRGERVQA